MIWTPEEDNIISECKTEFGFTNKEISEAISDVLDINRSTEAVRGRSERLNIKSLYNKKLTKEEYLTKLNKINKNIKLIGIYINTRTKTEHTCTICQYIWNPRPSSIIHDMQKCPNCSRLNKAGGYGQLTKQQANNLGYDLYLYHIKLLFENEIFYKYGLTKNADRSRYNNYKPYKVIKEISFEEYDAWEAISLEKELKSNYRPKYHFDGWTECYIL